MSDDIRRLLEEDLAAAGIEPNDTQVDALARFVRLLLEKNRRVNLTAARDARTLIDEHVHDSLTLVPLIRRYGAEAGRAQWRMVDVGSGGGLPALPLAIVLERCAILCIESIGKKARAIREMAAELALGNVLVSTARAETLARDPQWREQADFATARAVGHLATASELALPFVRVGGRFLAQKGPDPRIEIDEARGALELLGGGAVERVEVQPRRPGGRRRTVVVIEKTAATPDAYPRRPGMPAKRPLLGRKQRKAAQS
jgi:16S rRNA (guanine527-N7)-methyltransferase